MNKKVFLISAVMMFSMLGTAIAAEDALGIDLDATWVSKYIWRGFDLSDDVAAFQPSITFDLYNTGWSFNVWSSFAASGGSFNNGTASREDLDEMDYTLTYTNSMYEGEAYRTIYALSYVFYDYTNVASNDADLQEYNISLAWPDICPAGFVPSYTFIQMWPSEGSGAVRDYAGFIHVLGIGYDYICPDMPELPLSFTWNTVYNDGTGGDSIDHDWSHMVWGVSTSVNCPMGGTLTPALYYQYSMEDTVNTEDELWVGISYGYSF